MDNRFDDLLHTVITEKGQGIYGFFDVVFGFLYRRTDLYYEMAPNENMGFLPGQGEAIVYNYFHKYQNLHFKERVPKRNIDPKEIEDFMKIQKEKQIARLQKEKEGKTNTTTLNEQTVANKDTDLSVIDDKTKNKEIDTNNVKTISSNKEGSNTNSDNNDDKNTKTISNVTNNTSDIKKIDPKFETISTYNGDTCDKYSWSQGVRDVQIQFNLPSNTTKKDVKLSKIIIYFS